MSVLSIKNYEKDDSPCVLPCGSILSHFFSNFNFHNSALPKCFPVCFLVGLFCQTLDFVFNFTLPLPFFMFASNHKKVSILNNTYKCSSFLKRLFIDNIFFLQLVLSKMLKIKCFIFLYVNICLNVTICFLISSIDSRHKDTLLFSYFKIVLY